MFSPAFYFPNLILSLRVIFHCCPIKSWVISPLYASCSLTQSTHLPPWWSFPDSSLRGMRESKACVAVFPSCVCVQWSSSCHTCKVFHCSLSSAKKIWLFCWLVLFRFSSSPPPCTVVVPCVTSIWLPLAPGALNVGSRSEEEEPVSWRCGDGGSRHLRCWLVRCLRRSRQACPWGEQQF